MKTYCLILLVGIAYFQFSCNSTETKNISTKDKKNVSNLSSVVSDQTFTIDSKTLTKDFETWYNYTYYNVRLSQDFIGLDIDSSKIDKATLLNKLLTENVVAFKTKIVHGKSVYKLFNLNTKDESIKATIKQMASTEIAHFKMEGVEIPDFNFVDLNGKSYNKLTTKGKIIVLKCWFIHCVACVREFPELNKLVNDNEERDDILFISLALDSKADLIKFLQTKEFKYATIPEMESYMVEKLNIIEYPTHLLIDKHGKIIKVVNKIDDLEPFLKSETDKNTR